MKASSHRSVVAALVLGIFVSTAFAGLKSSQEVIISTSALKPYATGDVGYVRNTLDSTQYIGCEYTATAGDCFAVNSAGLYKTCSTTDPALLEVMHSINGDSNLFFSWNTDGTCKSIRVEQDSMPAPK
jgi:hypothetical protein